MPAAMTITVFLRQEHSDTQGPTPRNNADFIDRVVFRHESTNNSVTCFVIRRIALLVLGHHHGLALSAHHNLVFGELKMLHTHGANIGASGKQGGFVDQVSKVGAGKSGRSAGDLGRLDVFRQWHFTHVHLENLFATADIRQTNHHLAIKTSGAQQCRVQHVRAVGGSDHDNAIIHLKPIHFYQQLVKGLLTFIMPPTKTGATMSADRINFIDKDNTG